MSGVCNAAQRRRRVNIGRILLSLGFLITAISLITLNTVNAATNPFKITDVSITAKSSGVNVNVSGFEDTKIISGVTFYHLDDSVTYQITLNNSDTESHTINSITDDNASPYLTYNYSTHAGEEIAAGADLVLEVEVVYSTEVSEVTARAQNLNIKFSINYETEDEIAVPDTGDSESSATVPNTGTNTNDSNSKLDFVPLIFVGIGALLIIMGLRKSKLSTETKIIALALLGTFVTVSAVNAISNDFTFEFENNVDLQSILVVTYTVDGQETTVVIPYGGTLTLDDPSASTGYNFSGWEDENGEEFDPSTPITGDISISPVFRPNQFAVSIDTDNDGVADVNLDVTYGDGEYLLPVNNFSEDGYYADGWVDDQGNYYDDLTNVYSINIPDGSNITIVPNLSPITYTVELDIDGDGQTDQTISVTYGQETLLPTNEKQQTGYHPNGWLEGGPGGTPFANGMNLGAYSYEHEGTIRLEPYMVPNQYEVFVDADNDGTADLSWHITYGQGEEEYLDLGEYTFDYHMPGHTQDGWVDGDGNRYADGADLTQLDVADGGSITIVPYMVANEFIITIDTDGDGVGDANRTYNVTYGDNFQVTLPQPHGSAAPGYHIDGWTDGTNHFDEDHVVFSTDFDVPNGSTVLLTADSAPNHYWVRIDLDGDQIAETQYEVDYGQDGPYLPVNDIERACGYPDGWRKGNGERIENGFNLGLLEDNHNSDVSIWPNYIPYEYEVYIDTDNDGNAEDYHHIVYRSLYDDDIYLPTNDFYKEGHLPAGWIDNTGRHYDDGFNLLYLMAEDGARVEFYPYFRPISYNLYIDLDDDTVYETVYTDVVYGEQEIIMPSIGVTKTGFTFNSWTDGENRIIAGTDLGLLWFTEDGDDVYIYPSWRENHYYITYEINGPGGGWQGCDMAGNYNVAYTETVKLTKNCYTASAYNFAGWSTSANGEIEFTDEQEVSMLSPVNNKHITLYAKWTPKIYRIVYHYDGGVDPGNPTEYTYEDLPVRLTLPTKTGYVATGWTAPGDEYQSSSKTIYAPGDYEFTAHYRSIQYRVDLHGNGGSNTTGAADRIYCRYDSECEVANFYTNEGYSFVGWSTSADGSGNNYGEVVLNLSDRDNAVVDLYAQWEEVGPTATTFADAYSAAGKTKVTRTADGEKYYTLQDMNSSICSAVSLSTQANYSDTQEIQVMDNRDEKLYWIAKTLDGKCWMTQNLDLDLSTNKTLTHTDTDLGWGNDAAPTTWTPSSATVSVSSSDDLTGLGSGSSDHPESIDVGDWYWTDTWYSSDTYYYLDIANNGAGDKFSTTPYAGNGTHGHVGNYYNWTAVMAYNYFGQFNIPGAADYAPDLQNSICPAGWRLPTISTTDSSKDDYANLNSIYNGTNTTDELLTMKPLYFIRAGEFIGSNRQIEAGETGMYWSGSTDQGSKAFTMLHKGINASNSINPHYRNNRFWLLPIRCVAR